MVHTQAHTQHQALLESYLMLPRYGGHPYAWG
jgi:hypothetical protein